MIGTARSELKRWSKEIAEKDDWRRIREDVEVNICRGPDGTETFSLCRSASRIEKERAMHERLAKRIEEGLQTLSRRIDKTYIPHIEDTIWREFLTAILAAERRDA